MNSRNLTLVGILTWLIVGIPSVVWAAQHHVLMTAMGAVWVLCYCAFIVLFVLATRDKAEAWQRIAFPAAQSAIALACIALQPNGLTGILLVIVAAEIGPRPTSVSLTWISAQSLAFWWLERHADSGWWVLAYFAFQLFALVSLRIAHQEGEARLALAEANAELQVATGLLDISSRTEERLRIARDLHDVLGHHLTALTLNLEVAAHLTDGEAREQIEKSKSIAKVLLNDVRSVVSRLRHHEAVDLAAALRALKDVIERPAITLDVTNERPVTDPAVAQVALRAIQEIVTNAVRHSGARNLWLKLATEDHALAIAAHDDGAGTDQVRFGNGLRGMRERVEQLHGTMAVSSMRGRGFSVNVRIPLAESTA